MSREFEWYNFGPYEKVLVLWEEAESYVKMRCMDVAYELARGKQYNKIRPCEEIVNMY